MYSNKILKEVEKVLLKLDAQNYRNGFNDSTGTHVQDVIQNPTDAKQFWSAYCAYGSGGENYILESLGDELFDLFDKVDTNAEKKGAFKMPSWGCSGT